MVGRGHTKESLGWLNVSSIYLNTLFYGRSVIIPNKPWGC